MITIMITTMIDVNDNNKHGHDNDNDKWQRK